MTDSESSDATESSQPEQNPEVLLPGDTVGALGGLGEAGGGLDLGSMMQMAQDMQAQMLEAQGKLATTEVEGTAGGGLVTVTLNGHLHLRDVDISPQLLEEEDLTVIEDLILAAWQAAHDEVAKLQAEADPLGAMGGLGGAGSLTNLFGDAE